MIFGEAADNALRFANSKYNISSRLKTSKTTLWSPAPWSEDDAGADQQTPDLSTIVQEIVDRSLWNNGNSMVFIIEGDGKRVAESYNGAKAKAPQLFVSYNIIDNNTFTYQWSNGATSPSITISPANSMNYSVTITDADGCSYIETVFVEVDEDCK